MERGCSGAAEAAWQRPARQRRRRSNRTRRDREEAAAAPEKRLQEARSELQSSGFWDSGRRTILNALSKLLDAGKVASEPSGEKVFSALQNLQLTGPDAAVLGSSTQPQAEPKHHWQCVCYGLGNFSLCAKARCQLALLLLLLEELQIPPHLCYIFDPIFSALERESLARLGLTVLLENEEGKRRIHGPTLFYMIHCGKALYNNLLWSNWSVGALSKMVIIGNSFRGIKERVLTKVLQKDYRYIAKILTATEEDTLPAHPRYLDVFNDTSVHHFPVSKLTGLPQETWGTQDEPLYEEDDQQEIIRNR